MTESGNPIRPFLEGPGYLVVDGGLASELEHGGFDLRDELWSARLLVEAPEAIFDVHTRYLEAGADCIISASYQATIEAFVGRGSTESAAEAAIRRAVRLAAEARDTFWENDSNRGDRLRPLVAASVGPYGAYLANGAEFTGDYDLDERGLVEFHRRRWEILRSSGADLLACETIPSAGEARALARLLTETPDIHAWFSFSCRDGGHISDGTPIANCVRDLASTPRVVAVGVNCTAPVYVRELVETIRSVTDRPIVVYPNSGEIWDPDSKSWKGPADPEAFAAAGRGWRDAGAKLLGGCCRTRPEDIRRLREALQS
jgi:homocysteine S-methyltransferase